MTGLGFVRRWAPLFVLAALAGVARGQVTISATPLQLNFNVAIGAISAPQTVEVTTSIPTTVIIQVLTGEAWLALPTGPVNTSSVDGMGVLNLPVRANATNLAPGPYQGTFRISTQTQSVTITVSLNAGGASTISASPASLSFTADEGALTGNPAQATVQINSSTSPLAYTASVTTAAGGNWLLLSSTSGTTGDAGLVVSVNPSTLSPGTYTGTIRVESPATGDVIQVSVTLTVGSGASLIVTPTVLSTFLYQSGGTVPAQQVLSVTASAGVIGFTVAESPNVGWLTVTPTSGTARDIPVNVALSVNTSGLVVGAYTTQVVITPDGGTPLPPIPVRLAVSASPLLQVSRNSLAFSTPLAGPSPPSQVVNITAIGSGTAPGFTVMPGAGWLVATPSQGTTPGSISVTVNPSGLAVGTHNSSLIIRPSNGDQYFHEVHVSFTILDLPKLTAGPAGLLFTQQSGFAAPPQVVSIRSTGQPINFVPSTTTSNCGPGWLNVTPSQTITPAALNVTIISGGLPSGMCSGTVEVRFDAGAGLEILSIPVTVVVSDTPALRITFAQGFGVVTVIQGQVAPPQQITLTSTNPTVPIAYGMTATSEGGTWLLPPVAGTTPANVAALVLPAGLPPGTYRGDITISSPSLPLDFTVPVTLTVLPEIRVSVSPQALVFSQPQGGSASPAQTISMHQTAGPGATFEASITQISGGDWLQLNRTSGSAEGDISVSIKPNSLPIGIYSSRITLSFANSTTAPVQIPVTLNVVDAQRISTSVSSLTFSYQITGSLPPSQTFTISGAPGPSNFTVGTTSTGWLSISSQSGTTPAQISASVNPAGLSAGSYSGSIVITAPGAAGSPLTIAVTLNVTGAPPPVIDTVTNTASNQPGPITGGQLVTLKGTFLPPGTPDALFSVTPQNTIPTLLAGIRVLFDGIPGSPIYVSRGQINVMAPYEILGRASVSIVVEYQGVTSAPFQVAIATSAPGIYTLDSTGSGQVAAFNQNGTVNGPSAPAPPGTTLVLYLNGGGQTNPPSASGTVTPLDRLYHLLGTASVEIGGQPATIQFIGDAPGLVTGVIQANVTPNANVHGTVSVRITINGAPSPPGPTVVIQ